MKAIVFGEISMDILIKVPSSAPQEGVIRGDNYTLSYGGMGANQAIALSRLGVQSYLVGRLGKDDFSKSMLKNLTFNGVDVQGVEITDTNSPLAVLAIDDNGEFFRVIAFVEGVNLEVNQSDIGRFSELMSNADIALFQLGYPNHIVTAAIKLAKEAKITTILDPFPILGDLPSDMYSSIDIITPNRREASQLVGFPLYDDSSIVAAAKILHQRGISTVVIKLGAQGAFCSTEDDHFMVPSFNVNVIDNVGAGDAFNAGLAAALIHNRPIHEAVVWGVANGALSATGQGAQSALPTLEQLKSIIN